MDSVDMAAIREEQERERVFGIPRPDGPPFTGECYYCETDLPEPRRWCDSECRDQWQNMAKRTNQGN